MLAHEIISLDRSLTSETADLYAGVFEGPPWYEKLRCKSCNAAYGTEEDLEKYHNGVPCRNCGQALDLGSYWRDGAAVAVYEDAVQRKGFVGVGLRVDGKMSAFSWGYQVPQESTPSVLFEKVAPMLEQKEIIPEKTFYSAETGVLYELQSKGLGTEVSYNRLKKAQELNFQGACFRTINPKLVQLYNKFFGESGVRTLFNDPDPLKADRTWYYCSFADLKELPELG